MSDAVLWVVAAVVGEVLLLLLVFLSIAFFRQRAAARRDAKAMKALVARVKKGKAAREQAIETFLKERVGLDGEALAEARGALLSAQMGLLRDFVTVYGQRNAGDAGRFDERVFAAADAYHQLDGDVTPAGGEGASSADDGDSEGLRQKNARLEEELRITMETMSRMLKEYSTMFAVASDVAAPIAGSLQSAPAADGGQAVMAEPEELKPAAARTDGEDIPDATGSAVAGAADDADGVEDGVVQEIGARPGEAAIASDPDAILAEISDDASGVAAAPDDDASGRGQITGGEADAAVSGEVAVVDDDLFELPADGSEPSSTADGGSRDAEPDDALLEVAEAATAPQDVADDETSAVELDEALFDAPVDDGGAPAGEAEETAALELDEALFDAPVDDGGRPVGEDRREAAVELDEALFDAPVDDGGTPAGEAGGDAAVELDETLFDITADDGGSVAEIDDGDAVDLDEALFDASTEDGEKAAAALTGARDIADDLFDGLEEIEDVEPVEEESTKRPKAASE